MPGKGLTQGRCAAADDVSALQDSQPAAKRPLTDGVGPADRPSNLVQRIGRDGLSAPPGTIHRTTAIDVPRDVARGNAGGHRNSRTRPRPKHNAGPCDATSGI